MSAYKFLFVLLVFGGFSNALKGQQRADAFIVNVFDQSVKVVSPDKSSQSLHAIIKNNTLTTIRGKIQTSDNIVVSYFTLHEGDSESVKIGDLGLKKLFFFPLSPSFQEVELKIGMKAYEIPPEK